MPVPWERPVCPSPGCSDSASQRGASSALGGHRRSSGRVGGRLEPITRLASDAEPSAPTCCGETGVSKRCQKSQKMCHKSEKCVKSHPKRCQKSPEKVSKVGLLTHRFSTKQGMLHAAFWKTFFSGKRCQKPRQQDPRCRSGPDGRDGLLRPVAGLEAGQEDRLTESVAGGDHRGAVPLPAPRARSRPGSAPRASRLGQNTHSRMLGRRDAQVRPRMRTGSSR